MLRMGQDPMHLCKDFCQGHSSIQPGASFSPNWWKKNPLSTLPYNDALLSSLEDCVLFLSVVSLTLGSSLVHIHLDSGQGSGVVVRAGQASFYL